MGSDQRLNTPILLVGTGALASLFAARLSEASERVWMLGSWPEGVNALREHGVRLVSDSGETRWPVSVVESGDSLPDVRYAIVLVKAWQTERTAKQLSAILPSHTLVLTLQNGLGNRETLANTLGAERVALGVTTTGATLLAPGVVRPGGEGVITVEENPRLHPLLDALRHAGFTVEMTERPGALLWKKIVINAAINPLTALLRVPNGDLLAQPESRTLLAALAEEAAQVATAEGYPVPDPVTAAELVAEHTATNHSSMYQDMQRGAPTEIDAICGEIVRRGEKFNIPTPTNRVMWQLVNASIALSTAERTK